MKEEDIKDKLEMFNRWDAEGRRENGEMWEILVNDPTGKFIPKRHELEMAMDCHDGFAVGNDGVSEYVMVYPTQKEVMDSESMRKTVEFYVGQPVIDTGIGAGDVALTFGQVVQKTPYRQAQREAENFIDHSPDWLIMMAHERIKNKVDAYDQEVVMPQIRQINERFHTGLRAIAKSKGFDNYSQIEAIATKPAERLTDDERTLLRDVKERIDNIRPYIEAARHSVQGKLNDWRNRNLAAEIKSISRGMDRMSDIRLVRHTNGELSVRCKIDGVQQPMRRVDAVTAARLQNAEPEKIRAAAVQSYITDILKNPMQQQKRGLHI